MTDEDCPGEKGHKEKIELAAREIVRRLGGNAPLAAFALASMAVAAARRSEGGKNSAKSRRAKMATSKERVLELAKKIRDGDETLVQTELAAMIAEKNDPQIAVDYDRILTFISELEAKGRLPRAQRRRNT
jgi:uroporphyrinogen-III decarboxylase